ncbi:hypothetical protein PoB_000190300 [Plakobranchus ocellatus]|uniref:Uncharacterized protein n=1 Tax=Plakobranchus ocellatus TaxID=259542 RepID=A0AAV3XZI9_9GAST|nr:hypothetical protein PoB_000190300 [Plakobranchus ocellatus]
MLVKRPASHLWHSVSGVASKPAVLSSTALIGCIMLWLASKQVKSLLQILLDLKFFGPLHAVQIPDKPRYLLFGLLTLVFVWLDLFLVKILMRSVVSVVLWSRKRLQAGKVSGKRMLAWLLY